MEPIISGSGKIVLGCDFGVEMFPDMLKATRYIDEIAAYKIPSWSGKVGWKTWIELNRVYDTKKPLIYDHQTLGTDVLHIAKSFMEEIKSSGFDAIILKPRKNQPQILRGYIHAAKENNLGVMVVGHMTNESVCSTREFDESMEIYRLAKEEDVVDFGVPGNNLEFLEMLKRSVFQKKDVTLYPIGIGQNYQGGNLEEITKVLSGFNFHPIIGRAIYESENIEQTILNLTKIIQPK